jgi:putative hemolysin
MNAQAALLSPIEQPARTATQALQWQWARHQDEVREAQRLRHQVFVQELGARLSPIAGTLAGHDADVFDAHCEHLLVRTTAPDGGPGEVVACYRMLSANGAKRVGGFYADTEFDLTRLRGERHRMAELGRACVHPNFRRGSALLMMWGAIAQRAQQQGLDLLIGCASVPARDGGAQAWGLWNTLVPTHLAPIDQQVRPRIPLHPAPVSREPATLPPLLRGYLNAGARLLGAPAWDADFRCADFPLLLPLARLPASYRKRFFGPELMAA